jgi:dUTPase
MGERAWSRKTMVIAAVAATLAAAMPQIVGAAADSYDRLGAGAGHQITAIGGPGKVDPDPTGDRSIIIECVVLGDHPIHNAIGSRNVPGIGLGSVPRHPLGPSKCWIQENKPLS